MTLCCSAYILEKACWPRQLHCSRPKLKFKKFAKHFKNKISKICSTLFCTLAYRSCVQSFMRIGQNCRRRSDLNKVRQHLHIPYTNHQYYKLCRANKYSYCCGTEAHLHNAWCQRHLLIAHKKYTKRTYLTSASVTLSVRDKVLDSITWSCACKISFLRCWSTMTEFRKST